MQQYFIPFCGQKYSIVLSYHILSIHSSIDIHLGDFHPLAIVNRASVNMCAIRFDSYVKLMSLYFRVNICAHHLNGKPLHSGAKLSVLQTRMKSQQVSKMKSVVD